MNKINIYIYPLSYLGLFMVAGILPGLLATLSVSAEYKGRGGDLIALAQSIGFALGLFTVLAIGRQSLHFFKPANALLCIGVVTALLALPIWIPPLLLLAAGFVVLGYFSGGATPLVFSDAIASGPQSQKSYRISMTFLGMLAGATIVAPAATQLSFLTNWRANLAVVAILCFMVAIILRVNCSKSSANTTENTPAIGTGLTYFLAAGQRHKLIDIVVLYVPVGALMPLLGMVVSPLIGIDALPAVQLALGAGGAFGLLQGDRLPRVFTSISGAVATLSIALVIVGCTLLLGIAQSIPASVIIVVFAIAGFSFFRAAAALTATITDGAGNLVLALTIGCLGTYAGTTIGLSTIGLAANLLGPAGFTLAGASILAFGILLPKFLRAQSGNRVRTKS